MKSLMERLVFQNNETAAMLVYQENSLGVTLFSYMNTFFCFNKLTEMLAMWVKTLYKLLLGFAVFASRLASHVLDRVFYLMPVRSFNNFRSWFEEPYECSNRKILTSSDITGEIHNFWRSRKRLRKYWMEISGLWTFPWEILLRVNDRTIEGSELLCDSTHATVNI